jgi:hypothetical protein
MKSQGKTKCYAVASLKVIQTRSHSKIHSSFILHDGGIGSADESVLPINRLGITKRVFNVDFDKKIKSKIYRVYKTWQTIKYTA